MNQNFNSLMKEAQKMQKSMQQAQEDLAKVLVEGKAGGGLVILKMTGSHAVKGVTIDPSLLDGDHKVLEQMVAGAIQDAFTKIETISKEKINALTAGLNLPTGLMESGEDEK